MVPCCFLFIPTYVAILKPRVRDGSVGVGWESFFFKNREIIQSHQITVGIDVITFCWCFSFHIGADFREKCWGQICAGGYSSAGGSGTTRAWGPPFPRRSSGWALRRRVGCSQILANFQRSVLGCIDSYDSEKRCIFQLFSRFTRLADFCTAPSVSQI